MLGVLYSLLSSASFGINTASTRRGVLSGRVDQGVFITVVLGTPLFFLATLASGQLFNLSDLSGKSYLLLAAAGVVHYLFGRYCNYRAIRSIGVNRTSPLQAISIVYTLLVAVFFLDETISPLRGFGIAFIMLAPFLILQRPRRGLSATVAEDDPPLEDLALASSVLSEGAGVRAGLATRVRGLRQTVSTVALAEGYFFALLAALAYGTSPILIRGALSGSGLGVLGALVSYVAASVVLIVIVLFSGIREAFQSPGQAANRWFLLGTVTVFLAQLFRFLALDAAAVSIVVPLQRMSSLFSLLFAFLINRQTESFGAGITAAILLSIIGSFLVAA